MELSRYNKLKDDLCELYTKIAFGHHTCWIAPKSMMATDELRNREEFSFEGTSGDVDYFDEPQKRILTIPMMMRYMVNFTELTELRFVNSNSTTVSIYEDIQKYLAGWCEMMREAPEIKTPGLPELKQLENLAYLLFSDYQKIKPFVKELEDREAYEKGFGSKISSGGINGVDDIFGLGNYIALVGINSMTNQQAIYRTDKDEFVSHLDALKSMYSDANDSIDHTRIQIENLNTVHKEDSLLSAATSTEEASPLASWYNNKE